jgi:hypothetical protein
VKKPNRLIALELSIGSIAKKDVLHVADTCQSSGRAEPRVQLQSAMSQPQRLGHPFAGRKVILLHGSEKKIIGGEVLRSPPRRHCNFRLKQFWLNG